MSNPTSTLNAPTLPEAPLTGADDERAPFPERHRPNTSLSRWYGTIPFFLIHVLVLGAPFFIEVSPEAVVTCVALYLVRMWAVTAGYHRYFSHRTFKTSRAFQFFLAFLAQTSAQKGALWWAAHHRWHHKYSDMPEDIHSPIQRGFLYSHVGWLFDGTEETDYTKIKDLAKYPELVWLNKYWLVPPVALGALVFFTLGWSGLVIGFFLSTVALWNGTFLVNSLAHVWGRRVFETPDHSRNSALISLVTLGEGWHNNHHHYQSCVRQGLLWWEFDPTYYVLKAMSWVGLVWDLKEPPARVVEARRAAGFGWR